MSAWTDLRIRRGSCPDTGALRVLLDSDERDTRLRRHVEGCPRCTAALERLRVSAREAEARLNLLEASEPSGPAQTAPALLRTRQRIAAEHATGRAGQGQEGQIMPVSIWKRTPVRATASLVAIFVLMTAFAFSPMRTLADGVLERFRVQKFAVITIPMDLVQPLQDGVLQNLTGADQTQLQQELQQLGAFSTSFSMDSARQVASIDEARSAYGDFGVPGSLPNGFGAPEVYVSDAGDATYVLNVERARQLIDEMGIPIYSLPDPSQYPTLTFHLDVPQAVALKYTGSDGSILAVGQIESPTLEIPEGIDMNALRDEILRIPGLPTDTVAEIRAVKDWQHTLILPIPQGASSDDVTVNGAPGIVIEAPDNQGSAVLWQEHGILHIVAGQVDRQAVLDVADSID